MIFFFSIVLLEYWESMGIPISGQTPDGKVLLIVGWHIFERFSSIFF